MSLYRPTAETIYLIIVTKVHTYRSSFQIQENAHITCLPFLFIHDETDLCLLFDFNI